MLCTFQLACKSVKIRLVVRVLHPHPFDEYQVVITEDELEIPLEAQGLSIFGSNHVSATFERLIAHDVAADDRVMRERTRSGQSHHRCRSTCSKNTG